MPGCPSAHFIHRFPDKTALFRAVLRQIIEELRPPAGTPLYEGRNLEEVRGRLARLMLRAVLMPKALALNRLMVAEAQRFSELAAIVAREGGRAQLVGQIAVSQTRVAGRRPGDRPRGIRSPTVPPARRLANHTAAPSVSARR